MQRLLFPAAEPLVERLRGNFFREIVLYIGKAKNLRKRLASYRVANPERLSRWHLRLLCPVTGLNCSAPTKRPRGSMKPNCTSLLGSNDASSKRSEPTTTTRPGFR